MIGLDVVRKAERYAELAHAGRFDRAGVPYIEHPRAVAGMVSGELEKAVAYLHDVVEDSDSSVEDIREFFGDRIADAVDCLTRRSGEPYMDYIRRLAVDPVARIVKMADLEHNMDVSRLPIITDADWARVKKYKKAYEYLSE